MNTNQILLIIAGVVILDITLMVFIRRRNKRMSQDKGFAQVLGSPSPIVHWVKNILQGNVKIMTLIKSLWANILDWLQKSSKNLWMWIKQNIPMLIEITLVVLWAFYMGRDLLNFNSHFYLAGGEFEMSTQSHYAWNWLPRCGTCMFWYGQINGGAPAFVDTHGAILHPFVSITTLLMGVVNGTKVVILLCLITVGLAQWWLARVMKLGSAARLWAAGLAIVGGHLAGKMDIGNVGLVVSLASASLVLPPLVDLMVNRNRKAVITLALALAMTWLGGQGYIQIGVIATFFPAALIYILKDLRVKKPLWRDILISIGISALLAGLFLVPLLHFWPNMAKDADPYFTMFQPLEYDPLNLVIRDMGYYSTEILGKVDIPYLFVNFIGWAPILMVFTALIFTRKKQRRLLSFFLLAITLVFLTTSLEFVVTLDSIFPQMAALRNYTVAQGLAVPLILGLGAWGVDFLWNKTWPRLGMENRRGKFAMVSLRWLIFIPFLFISIKPVYEFSHPYYGVIDLQPSREDFSLLDTGSTQWVAPLGSNWIPEILDNSGMISYTFRPWHWTTSTDPAAFLSLVFNPDNNEIPNTVERIGEVNILVDPAAEFAYVETDSGIQPCDATATAGIIDIQCDSTTGGTLIVKEHYYQGWTVRVDGQRAEFIESAWLSVELPAGLHSIHFRYYPWDVWVGLILTLTGIGLCFYLYGKEHLNAPSKEIEKHKKKK